MSFTQLLITYFTVWWISLLFVLPHGLSYSQQREHVHYAGAPENPNLKRKLLINTLVSAALTALIYLLLQSGLVPLRHVIQ